MELKSDGTRYSRITRRCKAIIENIQEGRLFSISEITDEIYSKDLPEFYLKRFNAQMSKGRTRDYVNYLVDLDIVNRRGNQFTLGFHHRSRDEEWAQALSDQAWLYIAKVLNKKVGDVPDILRDVIKQFNQDGHLTTLEGIVTDIDIEEGRSQEKFKWALYLYTDGDSCPFDIRHFPLLLNRTIRRAI
jgi:hypothetical protein